MSVLLCVVCMYSVTEIILTQLSHIHHNRSLMFIFHFYSKRVIRQILCGIFVKWVTEENVHALKTIWWDGRPKTKNCKIVKYPTKTYELTIKTLFTHCTALYRAFLSKSSNLHYGRRFGFTPVICSNIHCCCLFHDIWIYSQKKYDIDLEQNFLKRLK